MSTSTPDPAEPCGGFQDGELPVTDADDEWFRACSENFVDEQTGAATNLMFGLTSADHGKLSGTLKSRTTAAETRSHIVNVLERPVAEMRKITVKVLTQAQLHLHDDSANVKPPEAPPGHAYLDLQHLPTGKRNPAKRARETVRAFLFNNSEVA